MQENENGVFFSGAKCRKAATANKASPPHPQKKSGGLHQATLRSRFSRKAGTSKSKTLSDYFRNVSCPRSRLQAGVNPCGLNDNGLACVCVVKIDRVVQAGACHNLIYYLPQK
jgi:hypothetical protein